MNRRWLVPFLVGGVVLLALVANLTGLTPRLFPYTDKSLKADLEQRLPPGWRVWDVNAHSRYQDGYVRIVASSPTDGITFMTIETEPLSVSEPDRVRGRTIWTINVNDDGIPDGKTPNPFRGPRYRYRFASDGTRIDRPSGAPDGADRDADTAIQTLVRLDIFR